jgi:hypothetical protein
MESNEPIGFMIFFDFMRICQSCTAGRVGLDGLEEARLVDVDSGSGTPAASPSVLSILGDPRSKIVEAYLA